MDPTVKAILDTPFPGYQWPLDLAQRWARSKDPAQMEQAVDLLRGLTKLYPNALAVGQELAFVLIESGQEEEAEAELARLEGLFQGLDRELLCRWGRLFKDKGDAHARSRLGADSGRSDTEMAIALAHYRKSIDKYGQAFRLSEHYYPGINRATLTLILAALEASRHGLAQGSPPRVAELAQEVLEVRSLREPGSEEDEKVWMPATRGEAYLLREDWGQAAGSYGQALGFPRLTPHARDSMRKQVLRIVDSFRQLGVTPAAPFNRPDEIDTFFRADSIAVPTPASTPAPTAA